MSEKQISYRKANKNIGAGAFGKADDVVNTAEIQDKVTFPRILHSVHARVLPTTKFYFNIQITEYVL